MEPGSAPTVFAFGAVVDEMVTGEKAFEGKSQASLIGAILEREPQPMLSFRPRVLLALERVVKKCLAKTPDDRYHTMHDLADDLRWLGEGTPSDGTSDEASAIGSRLKLGISFRGRARLRAHRLQSSSGLSAPRVVRLFP